MVPIEKSTCCLYIYKHLIKITQNQGAHSLYNLMFLCKQAWIVFGQVIDYCLFINPVQNCLFDCSAIFLVPWENSCSRRHVLFFLNIQDQKFICILVESLVSLKSHFFVLCVLLWSFLLWSFSSGFLLFGSWQKPGCWSWPLECSHPGWTQTEIFLTSTYRIRNFTGSHMWMLLLSLTKICLCW